MAEGLLAASTPNDESTYQERRKQRAERFLAGTSRAAYRLDPLLERSLSTSASDISQEGSQPDSDSEDGEEETIRARRQIKRRVDCKRGCPAVLERMAKTFENYGKHSGKTAQYRRSSYPNPKDPERSPRNIACKYAIPDKGV